MSRVNLTPWIEITGGILSAIALLGIVVLAALGRMIPTALSTVALAAVPVYIGARNYNAGFYKAKVDGEGG